jgi:hypothetical protein
MVAQEGSDEFDLLVEVPSPTGDKDRQIGVWMEKGVEPSVDFGAWHTHAGVEQDDIAATIEGEDRIIDLIEGIMAGRHVLISYVGGRCDQFSTLIDLRVPDALLDEITSENAPNRLRIKTWSGSGDRDVTLGDLETE